MRFEGASAGSILVGLQKQNPSSHGCYFCVLVSCFPTGGLFDGMRKRSLVMGVADKVFRTNV